MTVTSAYTQLCNDRGGIEADVTVIRRSETCFWLITGSALGVRDLDWLERCKKRFARRVSGRGLTGETHLQSARCDVDIRDITSSMGVLNIQGPRARDILTKVCDDDLSHEAFPFMQARDIRIGYAPAVAYRVTYVGELGWELFIPTEYLEYAYETLLSAGLPEGMINMGYHAIDTLRLEKRFLAWGADITPDNNPFEAGLQFLIDWDKDDFIGRAALERIRQQGVTRKMCALLLDDPLPLFGGEAVYCDGQVVAQTTSGNFGHSLGKSIALAYMPTDIDMASGSVEVQAFDRLSKATIVDGSPYDPIRRKIIC